MERLIKQTLWSQLGASIDMLENAIEKCPKEFWNNDSKFWYNAYHCIFYLDYYLTVEPDNFQPPSPYTLSEFDPSGKLPDVVYEKADLLIYLNYCRVKGIKLVSELTFDLCKKRWINPYKNYSLLEIIIYNLRHVQHHAGQLNLLLRQFIDDAPKWVAQAKSN